MIRVVKLWKGTVCRKSSLWFQSFCIVGPRRIIGSWRSRLLWSNTRPNSKHSRNAPWTTSKRANSVDKLRPKCLMGVTAIGGFRKQFFNRMKYSPPRMYTHMETKVTPVSFSRIWCWPWANRLRKRIGILAHWSSIPKNPVICTITINCWRAQTTWPWAIPSTPTASTQPN